MVVAPVMTPRFGSVSPNLTLRSPTVSTSSSVREQLGSQKPYDGLDPQDQKDDDANTQDDVRGGNQPVPVTAFHAGGVEQPQQRSRQEGQKHGPHRGPEEHQAHRLAEHDERYRREGKKDQERTKSQALFRDVGSGLLDRKSTRLNSSHANISYAVFCLKKKKKK